jgi:asparagine N-glycosylation enzyme membrane subunit Stt3
MFCIILLLFVIHFLEKNTYDKKISPFTLCKSLVVVVVVVFEMQVTNCTQADRLARY